MTTSRRHFVALALLAVGLAVFVVDNVSLGWTVIGVVGVLCLVLAVGAQLVAIRKGSAHS
jgi:membrane-bound ClpP family serine protease